LLSRENERKMKEKEKEGLTPVDSTTWRRPGGFCRAVVRPRGVV